MRTRAYGEIQLSARALPAPNIDLGSKLKGKQRESGGSLPLPLGGWVKQFAHRAALKGWWRRGLGLTQVLPDCRKNLVYIL